MFALIPALRRSFLIIERDGFNQNQKFPKHLIVGKVDLGALIAPTIQSLLSNHYYGCKRTLR